MYGFREHWEGWLRPLTLALVGGGFFLAWYLGWLPDGVVGWPLLIVALGAPVLGVALSARRAHLGTPLNVAVGVTLLASLSLALVAPVRILGPNADIVSGEIATRGQSLAVPAEGEGPEGVIVYAHGRPAQAGRTDVRLELKSPGQHPLVHQGSFSDEARRGRRTAGVIPHHDIIWSTTADLSKGAELAVEGVGIASGSPVHVEIRRAPPGPRNLLYAAVPVVLLALVVDALARRRGRTYLAPLALGAVAFSLLFTDWFAPGTLTKTAFGAGFGALAFGGLLGLPLAFVVRKLIVRGAVA
ncbi:MAG: hypothetical protein H6744_06370 [Deltaproteobacteria bacterium]|nr:hypothetical protein [Deltaproteobacteria bacterium]MCB9786305.1 hypothetical protein [Deltaproteobacteria bacterium]